MDSHTTITEPSAALDLRVAADGEVMKLRPPLRYRIRPLALNVCVPG